MVSSLSDFMSFWFNFPSGEDIEAGGGGLEVEGPGSVLSRSESIVS